MSHRKQRAEIQQTANQDKPVPILINMQFWLFMNNCESNYKCESNCRRGHAIGWQLPEPDRTTTPRWTSRTIHHVPLFCHVQTRLLSVDAAGGSCWLSIQRNKLLKLILIDLTQLQLRQWLGTANFAENFNNHNLCKVENFFIQPLATFQCYQPLWVI